MMHIPFLDLQAHYDPIFPEIEAAISRVFAAKQFILGQEVEECETAVAAYCGGRYACGASSGTDALLLALMCEGIGPGDEVITTPYTFFATAGCIARLGATPVFVDIDARTLNMNIDRIEEAVTPRTRAIIPVHLFGQMMNMDAVMKIAGPRNIIVIEDAAQAIGSRYADRCAGTVGDYGCFSFYPGKNLGAAGDAGMVFTSDRSKLETLRQLRSHGAHTKYYHRLIGGNFRLDALQAAIIKAKLPHLDAWIDSRRRIALSYRQRLAHISAVMPLEDASEKHTYNAFVIRTDRRDALRSHLSEKGIETQIYYPLSLHLQECFAYLNCDKNAFPQSVLASYQTLALPLYPELSDVQVDYVCDAIRAFFAASS